MIDVWHSYLRMVAITVAIWVIICVMAQDLQPFWPGWAGPWKVVLLVTTVRGLTRDEPQEWAARKARKWQAKADKRARKRSTGDPEDN